MTIFYSDMEPLSQYSPVQLHLSPATRILSENPVLEHPALMSNPDYETNIWLQKNPVIFGKLNI